MEGCDFNEAFPEGPIGSVGCLDRTSGDESRRQEKKRARRCRGPQAEYLNKGWNMVGAIDADPDRPAVKPMDPVPALNTKTGLTQHSPVTQQYNYESFVGGMDNLPAIRKDTAGPTSLQKTDPPSFFGASPDDGPVAPTMNRRNVTEAFQSGPAPFTDIIGSEDSYKLEPDFTKAFNSRGAQKASAGGIVSGPSSVRNETSYLTPTSMLPNSILPTPNVDMFWKENGLTGGSSSFFSHLRAPGGQPSGTATEYDSAVDAPASRREVLTKLDKIFARLDDMEATKSENAQTEILLFILTGIGIIFLMDVGVRAATSVVRRR
jgi:hypothetical protein